MHLKRGGAKLVWGLGFRLLTGKLVQWHNIVSLLLLPPPSPLLATLLPSPMLGNKGNDKSAGCPLALLLTLVFGEEGLNISAYDLLSARVLFALQVQPRAWFCASYLSI